MVGPQSDGLPPTPRRRAAARSGDQQVGRLDVAVDHAALVGVLQAQGRLADVVAGLAAPAAGRAASTSLPRSVAVDVLHDEEVGVAGLVGVVGHDDVGMRELGDRLDLAAEALDRVLVWQMLLADDLEGDDAVQAAMAGLEDLAHAAFADPFEKTYEPSTRPMPLPCRIWLTWYGVSKSFWIRCLRQGAGDRRSAAARASALRPGLVPGVHALARRSRQPCRPP